MSDDTTCPDCGVSRKNEWYLCHTFVHGGSQSPVCEYAATLRRERDEAQAEANEHWKQRELMQDAEEVLVAERDEARRVIRLVAEGALYHDDVQEALEAYSE